MPDKRAHSQSVGKTVVRFLRSSALAALIAGAATLFVPGCTDNSGNGHFMQPNADGAAGTGGGGGGGGGGCGDDEVGADLCARVDKALDTGDLNTARALLKVGARARPARARGACTRPRPHAPRPRKRVARNSLATRFMPSLNGVTTITSAAR